MAHTHQVVDSDIRFVINPITRAITRADAKKSSLVVGDHNSERFTFEIPKTVEGHDMSLCNVIRIHYLNTSSENKSVQSLGVYEVDDFGPDSEDENTMKFTWLISRKATQHVGPLAFTIQFACMTGFKVDYSWQSGIFSGITVSNAVNATEVVIDEYADILQQWWEQLYASSELPISVMPFNGFEELNGDTQNGMLYLLSDDPAVEYLEKIPNMEYRINGLDEEVKAIDTRVSGINSEVNIINEKISDIDDNIAALNTNHAQLSESMEDNIDDLKQSIGGLEQSIGGLEQSIDDLDVSISDVRVTVSNHINGIWERGTFEYICYYDRDLGDLAYNPITPGMYIVTATRVGSSIYATTSSFIMNIPAEYVNTVLDTMISMPPDVQYTIRYTSWGRGEEKTLIPYAITTTVEEGELVAQQSSTPATDITIQALRIRSYGTLG